MSFLQKYEKYKKKYIELKKIYQVGGLNKKRVEKEIKIIRETNLYTNIIISDDMSELTFKRISDNAEIKFVFTIGNLEKSGFPFVKPSLYINDMEVMVNNWSPANKLIIFLNFNKKVLILCHNQEVSGTFEPLTLENHHLGNIMSEYNFKNLFSEYNLHP